MSVLSPPRARLTARTVMTAPVVSVQPATSPWQAWSTMIAHGIRHLVVTSGGRCVGMIDDREIFAQWPMGPLALRRTRIESMMRMRTTVVLPDADLCDVAHIMAAERVDAVPVVDEAGGVLGVVTASDIVAAVATHGIRPAGGAG
jgi:CBS domain-containing membrane protein